MTPADLRAHRKSLGLSQAEYAVLMRVKDDRTVRRWEAGEQDIPALVVEMAGLMQRYPAVRRERLAAIEGR